MAFKARILCHGRTRGLYLDTVVGRNFFIGGRSMILSGVRVGDGCVGGAGAVVTRDVPNGCVVAGNPAKILRENIRVGAYGRFEGADETAAAIAERIAS